RGDPGPRAGDRGVSERVDEVRGEPVDEPVAVLRTYVGVVVGEADGFAVGADADEERAAVAVEEPGDGLRDGVLDGLALLVLSEVPAGGGLELDGEVLVVVDELLDGAQRRAAREGELRG